jgi:hypothetical protein
MIIHRSLVADYGEISCSHTLSNCSGALPIHHECDRLCRLAIIVKCIELYPESLAVPDNFGNLPWHKQLSFWRSAAIDGILMMIDKSSSIEASQ